MAVYKRYYKSYDGALTPEWYAAGWCRRGTALQQLFRCETDDRYSVACYMFPVIAG